MYCNRIQHINMLSQTYRNTVVKCNINFTTQYAIVNGKQIHVQQYSKNEGDIVTCNHGHELVLCKGQKIKSYFRHKNKEDVGGDPMTEWHSRMQSYFPIIEKSFIKKTDEQIRDRRADIFIDHSSCVIEIQHSKIDRENVICRDCDYKQHNVNVIWLVDGNTKDVIAEKLSTNNYIITFNEEWKYASFSHTYDFILLDIDDKIFKIPVKKVCNKMILVKEWKPIDYIMEKLKQSPNDVATEWEDDNESKASMTVHQKGAGNGKTFGIWKSISNNLDKQTYIVLTKQHSAKAVIFKELNDQAERNDYHIDNNIEELVQSESNRKYIVKYKHKRSLRKCVVIIGTIDSFVYNLTKAPNTYSGSNYFERLVNSITELGCSKVNEYTGLMKYADENIHLNRHTEIWIDEAQDLPRNYFEAIVKLMLSTKIDVVVVGDKLQSLEYKKNFMTCIEEKIPNIDVIIESPINENRRINVNTMSDKINDIIQFDKYDLPKISIPEDRITNLKNSDDDIIEIVDQSGVLSGISGKHDNEMVSDIINMFVENIIKNVDKEVNQNGYVPNDFLFVFPIMKNNNIASELETRLNHYWINKYGQYDNSYTNYAVLHKHETGQVINMDKSKNASRIVSIRTSKGDGRNVVFVLGCTEASLKIVGQCENKDLIYESYLHVALTRAKTKMYFGLDQNNDDLHARFGSNGLVEFKPKINNKLKLNDVVNFMDKEKTIKLLQENDVLEYSDDTESSMNIQQKQVVDWQYHCIRRSIYIQYAVFMIMNYNVKNSNFNRSQIKTILDITSKLNTTDFEPKQYYQYLNKYSQSTNKNIPCFPICNLSKKPCYADYQKKLTNLIKQNQESYKRNITSIGSFTPIESVVQHYVIDVFVRKNYHDITPVMIYNIIDSFEKKEDDTKTLIEESEKIKTITETAMKEILLSEEEISWNIEHMVFMHGNTSDMDIYERDIPIIGFTKSTVYHLMFKTDMNSLNYWDVMIETLCERFLIFNPKDKGNDVTKFKNKVIKTYIFVLKQNKFKLIQWNWDKLCNTEIKELFKDAIVKHLSRMNKQLFHYCSFIRKSNKWKGSAKTPFEFIANQFVENAHIRDFFKSLHEQSKINKEHVLNIVNSENEFNKHLSDKIKDMCDSFFNINNNLNDDEW